MSWSQQGKHFYVPTTKSVAEDLRRHIESFTFQSDSYADVSDSGEVCALLAAMSAVETEDAVNWLRLARDKRAAHLAKRQHRAIRQRVVNVVAEPAAQIRNVIAAPSIQLHSLFVAFAAKIEREKPTVFLQELDWIQ